MDLSTLGLPVQIVPPQLNAGALSGLRPIQLGGSPIQISPLAAWNVPTPQPYIANALASLGQSIGAGIQERGKFQERKEEKEAERAARKEEKEADRTARAEEKKEAAKERQKDRDSHEKIAAMTKRAKDASVTAEDDVVDGIKSISGVPIQGEKADDSDPASGVNALIGTKPEPSQPRPQPSMFDVVAPPSAPVLETGKTSLDLSATQPPPKIGSESFLFELPKIAIPPKVTIDGPVQPKGVQLSDLMPKPITAQPSEAQSGETVLGEPALDKTGPQPKPATFRNMNRAERRKEILDSDPNEKYTLDLSKVHYNPKTGLMEIKEGAYVQKDKKPELTAWQAESLKLRKQKTENDNINSVRNAVSKSPQIQTFIKKSGPLDMWISGKSAFEKAVIGEKEKTGGVGINDAALIGLVAQIDIGGKATTFELETIKKARSLAEKIKTGVLSTETGQILGEATRNAMFSQLVTSTNEKAENANKEIARIRALYKDRPGISDAALPQYVPGGDSAHHKIMTKDQCLKEIDAYDKTIKSIELDIQKTKDETQKSKLQSDSNKLKQERMVLADRLKKSKHNMSMVIDGEAPTDRDFNWSRNAPPAHTDQEINFEKSLSGQSDVSSASDAAMAGM